MDTKRPGCGHNCGASGPARAMPTESCGAGTHPLGGHLGKTKTAHRIIQQFYWPTIYRDVAQHCRTCKTCQLDAAQHVPRAPLIPLPVMSEPFERVAIDIIGPLPRSRSGKRYILVLCDYATHYPEAVALCSTDAGHIAEELVQIFARVGVPSEITEELTSCPPY